jgi:Cu(I)/Ag(I) efflux system periplasmic protein CusF
MRAIATILMLLLGASAWAQGAPVDGEVRKVDKEAGKMTIKHGPIPHLDMGAMTMVFRVKEPAMLDRLQVGDRIRFTAEKIGGAFTVTAVESVK